MENLTQKAEQESIAPHTYHDRYRNTNPQEAQKRIADGDAYVIRFKNPNKEYTFFDLIRGQITFPKDMVGDFVIVRSNGVPVYNFCCVVDDWMMKIDHVIRGEDHLNNTLRQLILYEALDAPPPTFAHCSLLIGKDRQKLSKRHDATSVSQYRKEGYLPQALANYLCLLGWGHPKEQELFNIEEIIPIFDLTRFNKASALYDINKLKFFNGQHMRKLSEQELLEYTKPFILEQHPFHQESPSWQKSALKALVKKIQLPQEFNNHLDIFFNQKIPPPSPEVEEIQKWNSTQKIKSYLKSELQQHKNSYPSQNLFKQWIDYIKKEFKINGKPLFKGIRVCLTNQAEGPDLKIIIPLTKVTTLNERLSKK